MENRDNSRRTLLKGGSAWFGLTVLRMAGPERILGQQDAEVIPWLDEPPPNPVPQITGNLLRWETLDSRLTPADKFFYVQHYGIPDGLNDSTWHVDLHGLVARPRSLTIADLKARDHHEVEYTLECSGNNGIDGGFFIGGIGNARWGGTRLAPLLESAGILDQGTEVVFWGADGGREIIRDNTGVVSGGRTGVVEPDTGGSQDLTVTETFARSMSMREAMGRDNLLCYEMNGQSLPREHGFPVRLIAPGWYGVANVKWLTRIEVIDHRFAGKFMARDYVTVREEQRNGQTVWTFTTVGRARLKSAPAKVTRQQNRYMVHGAAWGAPIASVQVQVDDGPWMEATLDDPPETRRSRGYTWRLWRLNWDQPSSAVHTIRSRAIDIDGNVQPTRDDATFASRRTFWEANAQIARTVRIP
ncbi:MAG TPA: molybdopterin-dependent oxidoreductase [Bryobacteraceae bacterium]|nr:molybdopterin-dependent oxidoreductase [Bryobacteraceae bacterium]